MEWSQGGGAVYSITARVPNSTLPAACFLALVACAQIFRRSLQYKEKEASKRPSAVPYFAGGLAFTGEAALSARPMSLSSCHDLQNTAVHLH